MRYAKESQIRHTDLLILAILVSVLFNMRVFLWVLEYGFKHEVRPRLYYTLFNFIIEGEGALVKPNEKYQYRNKSQEKAMIMICGVPKEFE